MMPHQVALMALEVIESAQRMAAIQAGMVPAKSMPPRLPPLKSPRCPYCNGKQTDRDNCPGCGAPNRA